MSIKNQWYPAFDHDGQGNDMVVYYDRRQDTNNVLYRESWSRLDANGNTLATGVVAQAFESDPTETVQFGTRTEIEYEQSL